MPSAVDLLEQDHRRVEMLFADFEQTGDESIALHICQELEVHATLEEQIVYPVLRRVDQELAQEAQHEHEEAKQLIRKIKGGLSGAALTQTVGKLKEAVEHHVQEEEGEVFPKMLEAVGGELLEMGDEMQQQKPQVMHVMAGDSNLLDLTKEELYQRAQEAGIPGRSSMTKEELAAALSGRS